MEKLLDIYSAAAAWTATWWCLLKIISLPVRSVDTISSSRVAAMMVVVVSMSPSSIAKQQQQ